MTKPLRLATRGSALALWQANRVIQLLQEKHPNLPVELVIVSTTPDRRPDASLQELSGDKGLFVRELEEALTTGKADAAVHSLKDVPIQDLPAHLHLAAYPERALAHDVWISRDGSSLSEIPSGSLIGTSALRRCGQLLAARPDLNPKPIRGNVGARIEKLHRGDYDAIILAAAGIERLNLTNQITEMIPSEVILNAAGQGIIAIEAPADSPWNQVLQSIDKPDIRLCAELERTFNLTLGADCHSATACHAEIHSGEIHFTGRVVSPKGTLILDIHKTAPVDFGIQIAINAANNLIDKGAIPLLQMRSDL